MPHFVATTAERLDAFLQRMFPAWAPDRLAALVAQGHVTVNAKRALAGRRLWPTELVDITLQATEVVPSEGPSLPVLFDGSGVVVVNKPLDLAVDDESPGPRTRPPRGKTVVTILAGPRWSVGGYAAPGVAHRLDAGTTGCLALALSDEGLATLTRAFETGAVTKQYLGWVVGTPPARGHLDTPYTRDPANPRRYTTKVTSPRRARLSFSTLISGVDRSLVSIELETGRTHQIRCQFADLGHPLLGDPLYGGPPGARPLLHAQRLAVEGLFDVSAAEPADWPAAEPK